MRSVVDPKAWHSCSSANVVKNKIQRSFMVSVALSKWTEAPREPRISSCFCREIKHVGAHVPTTPEVVELVRLDQ
jgi:hypothetical protein